MSMTKTELSAFPRQDWCHYLHKVAEPPLAALAAGRMRTTMPIECDPTQVTRVTKVTQLEALGRTLAGISPWLELADVPVSERERQGQMRQLSRAALVSALDPDSPDALQFDHENQALVDAAFLGHALLRSPVQLFENLDAITRDRLIRALRSTRVIKPGNNNWLLFSAMIETALHRFTGQAEFGPIEHALGKHEEWYVGDGAYSDGPEFHWDYYNSYVIQPMLLDVLEAMAGQKRKDWLKMQVRVRSRAQRFAAVQERLIAADGSYPPLGRSIAYRGGAFQLLAQMALRNDLPATLQPAQIRCALTAVLHRTMDAPNTFDSEGWLRIGLAGHQPGLGESYISTGSLYLCSTIFLPLGLPESARFWRQPDIPWSNALIWGGADTLADHSL
ncbi:MAG: DUF2264 domain-containing protein [Cephaloticoccus sp.]|nr:DUF2264 domain-containing protein [Cephaloticoccus sp.]MCF7761181.1 DUF2264 domain-containing protein [Cephaloticoccus sp.]